MSNIFVEFKKHQFLFEELVKRDFKEKYIGCWLYYFSRAISKTKWTRAGRYAISIVENLLYLIVVYFMYSMGANKHDYFFIALMAIAVALTFSEAGIDSTLFNNKIVMRLGRFSVPLYFCHIFWGNALNYFVPTSWRIRYRLAIYFAVSSVTAWLVMLLSSMIRERGPVLCKKIKKYFVKDHI